MKNLIRTLILTVLAVTFGVISACEASVDLLPVSITFNDSVGSFTLTSNADTDVKVMSVLYKNKKITSVSVSDRTSKKSGTRLLTEGLNLGAADTLKLFVWSGAGELKPMAKPYTLELNKLDILKVKDGYLKSSDGKTVILKGVNLGGWLLQETWMCPLLAFNSSVTVKNGTENAWANLDTLEYFEKNFGKAEAAELFEKYQDNYITEWDFKNIKDLGFNCVRIPFWYRNFMSDENGTYYTKNDDDNPGFKRLDWAIETAGKYGLYVVLDMHGCPGGQSGDHSTGKAGRNFLYFEEKYQMIMEDLWTEIADRYKLGKTVVSYDIMNEPLNNADTSHNVSSAYAVSPWVDTASDPRIPLYDRMIKAVREKDPYHNITIEAIWRMYKLPNPSSYGWTNMMYQLHSYDADYDTTNQLITSLVNARKNYGVAVYMGEFNPAVYYNGIGTMMKNNSINYTLWNYKISGIQIGSFTNWGLYYKDFFGDFKAIAGNSVYGKAASSWNGHFYYMNNSTNAEIKNTYENWWTADRLSTSKFTFNEQLYNLIADAPRS